MSRSQSVLIVASPGPLRDGLIAMLQTIPWVGTIHQAQSVTSALNLVVRHHPTLVLLDSSLPADRLWSAIREIKAAYAEAYCVVLAEDAQKQETAQSAGADDILPAGLLATRLFATIERLRPL